ncbi:hypothetical protein [Bosea sp. AS-1]|uniref:hypothetical protein n=1 Tax=Bosea sp. AS-1 TaxID=2015316 RepID=UPI0020BF5919|nr:hypothetical protein [Bosea sp. AS-1]
MVTETAAEVPENLEPAKKRDRRVERTVNLSETEIAAVEAAEVAPPAEARRVPEAPANT